MGRRFAIAGALAVALLTAVACSSEGDTPSTSLSSSPSSTPATTAIASITIPPTPAPDDTSASPTATASAVPPSPPDSAGTAVLNTPTAAAQHLYAAWQAGDQLSAAFGASHAAVTALFAHAWTTDTYYFGGCGTDVECDYNYTAGVIRMTIAGDPADGYTVTAVSFGTAG